MALERALAELDDADSVGREAADHLRAATNGGRMHPLEIGGICYAAAPFIGWYMGTEIGTRNLADTDRYDLLPRIAEQLGLDTTSDRSLWKDRGLVELNRAVLHSFDRAGVTVTDHHTESRRFLAHLDREQRRGRGVGADSRRRRAPAAK